jgi:hypothetical protein
MSRVQAASEKRREKKRAEEQAAKDRRMEAAVAAEDGTKVDSHNEPQETHPAPPSEDEKGDGEKRAAELPNATDKIMAACTAVMVVVVALQAYFNSGQVTEARNANIVAEKAAKAAERAADIAADTASGVEEQFKIDQRAWIGITSMRISKKEPGQPLIIEVYIRNHGKTMARKVIHKSAIGLSRGPIDISIFAKYIAQLKVEHGGRPTAMFPNETISFYFETPGKLTASQIKELDDGIVTIHIYGDITYDDAFGTGHVTEFSTFYDTHGGGKFQRTGYHNDAN